MHSELSEALEVLRTTPKRLDRLAEELADCLIRILDYAEAKGLDMESALLKKMEKNEKRGHRHGKAF